MNIDSDLISRKPFDYSIHFNVGAVVNILLVNVLIWKLFSVSEMILR